MKSNAVLRVCAQDIQPGARITRGCRQGSPDSKGHWPRRGFAQQRSGSRREGCLLGVTWEFVQATYSSNRMTPAMTSRAGSGTVRPIAAARSLSVEIASSSGHRICSATILPLCKRPFHLECPAKPCGNERTTWRTIRHRAANSRPCRCAAACAMREIGAELLGYSR